MSKRVFVSADWKEPFDSHSWDKEVVDRIRKWKFDEIAGQLNTIAKTHFNL